AILDRESLEQSPLADLHAIASELSIDGYRRFRKPELIAAILERQGGEAEAGAETGEAEEGEPRSRSRRRGRRRRRGDSEERADEAEEIEEQLEAEQEAPPEPEPERPRDEVMEGVVELLPN